MNDKLVKTQIKIFIFFCMKNENMKMVYVMKEKPRLVLCAIAMIMYQITIHWPQFQGECQYMVNIAFW